MHEGVQYINKEKLTSCPVVYLFLCGSLLLLNEGGSLFVDTCLSEVGYNYVGWWYSLCK